MNLNSRTQNLANEFINNINRIQDSYSIHLYGTPPGWDAKNKKPIPGSRARIDLIENFCKLKGL